MSRSKVKGQGQGQRSRSKVIGQRSRSRLRHRLRTRQVWRSFVYDSATLLFDTKARIDLARTESTNIFDPLPKKGPEHDLSETWTSSGWGRAEAPEFFAEFWFDFLTYLLDQRSAGRPSNISGTGRDRKSSEGSKCVSCQYEFRSEISRLSDN